MYVVGVNDRLCVLKDEMGSSEFWSCSVDIDVVWVYVVAAGGHVSSFLAALFF
jgi:hypothetical protein